MWHGEALYSFAAVLVLVWLLGAMGVYDVGAGAYALLGLVFALVAFAAVRRRV
jgi:hypothetical protein